MRHSLTLAFVAIAIAYPMLSHSQQPASFTPLTGDRLRSVLAGHYMENALSPSGAEHFCKSGRWLMVGGREPLAGSYEFNADSYCVTMSGRRNWCAQLSHREGDLFDVQFLGAGVGTMGNVVHLKSSIEAC